MTPDRLTQALRSLRWSQRGLAAAVRKDEREIRRWTSGERRVPPAIAAWIETLAAFHEAHPAPGA